MDSKYNTQIEYPLVTITTVSLNSAATIERTIASVLNQTYGNIEYILMDGLSEDDTVKIAKSYEKKFLEKGYSIKIISEQDSGMYDALNKANRLATGILIGNVNSDDYYEPDAVAQMVNLYAESNYDIAWGNIRVITGKQTFIKKAKKPGRICTTSGWCHPSMFGRREILQSNTYACESMYDDFDFMLNIRKQGKKIEVIDEVISNFSFGGMSTEKNLKKTWNRVRILYKVYRKYGMSRLYGIQRFAVEMGKYILS